MNNNFFNLLSEEQLALIRQTGDQLDVRDIIIEKDFWICWVLEKLFALPIKMAFKGGTSLSKVFGLIKRFSEDVDITIDYQNFKQTLDLENTSRTQLKKIGEQLKEQLKVYVLEEIFPALQEEALKVLPKKLFEITVSSNGEQLRFYYPSLMNRQQGYLRDHVFIEFGIRNSTEPCEKHQIMPYLAQVTDKGIYLPKPKVDTLSPARTFWEKATLIHVACHREYLSKTPDRLSRHWYDLFKLNNSWVREKALLCNDILKNVIVHKKAFFNTGYAQYDDCLNGKFRLIPKKSHQISLAQDFKSMIKTGMFYEDPPEFDSIIMSLKHLEDIINKKIAQ